VTGRLAKRYARALFDLAREDNTLEATGEELGRAVAAFEEPRLRPLCLSPILDRATRVRNTKEILGALHVSAWVRNLISLLAERDRLVILPEVARWYDGMLDGVLGRVRVAIRSAAPLAPAQKQELIELARRITGAKDVLAATDVDPDLLGGVVLDAEGTVYDGSLRSQLNLLSKEMAEGA
jgi:F-type H+-transporting ATPase subunit delta